MRAGRRRCRSPVWSLPPGDWLYSAGAVDVVVVEALGVRERELRRVG